MATPSLNRFTAIPDRISPLASLAHFHPNRVGPNRKPNYRTQFQPKPFPGLVAGSQSLPPLTAPSESSLARCGPPYPHPRWCAGLCPSPVAAQSHPRWRCRPVPYHGGRAVPSRRGHYEPRPLRPHLPNREAQADGFSLSMTYHYER
jgi:hypothetical protein